MQHYLPVQFGQDGVHVCLRPFLNNKNDSSRKHIRNLNAIVEGKLTLEAEKEKEKKI